MTLTIPTGQLVGALTDVAPFAFAKDDYPLLNRIRVEWDGHTLHTAATDGNRAGWSRWDADEPYDPDHEPEQEDLLTRWGSDNPQWVAHIKLADAQELVKVFKLPAKLCLTPLTVTHELARKENEPGRLMVERSADTGLSAHVMEVPTCDPTGYPDVRGVIERAETEGEPVEQIEYWAHMLADFGRVRAHGPMQMRFRGARASTWIAIGTRFSGVIAPHQEREVGPAAVEDRDEDDLGDVVHEDQLELVGD